MYLAAEKQITVAAEAATPADVLRCCSDKHPDVLLLEAALGGIELIEAISKTNDGVKVLVLGDADEERRPVRFRTAYSTSAICQRSSTSVLAEHVIRKSI